MSKSFCGVVWGDGDEGRLSVRVVSGQAARRWAFFGAGTAILCLLPALVAALPVPASALSAAQLRARILKSADVPYQGYAESDVNLDLPALPDLGNVIALLDGTTDQYAWYRSAGQWRADVLTTAGEDDTYVTSRGTFTWNYASDLMTQIQGTQPVRLPRAADLLPPALAARLLSFAGRADRISRLPSQRVAGIDAAGLRLVPASQATTIGAVDIWADPVSGLPVQVSLYGRRAGAPLLVSRFLDISLSRPSVADVTPEPAPGVGFTVTGLADVSGVLNGFGPPLPGRLAGFGQVASPAAVPDVAVYGDGFARFVVLPLPERTGAEAMTTASAAGASIQIQGGTAVLVTTPLLTVLLASPPGGPVYLLTGAVTARLLQTAATQLLAAG
jgi:hypothetical protein